jgi:hypothetical protein
MSGKRSSMGGITDGRSRRPLPMAPDGSRRLLASGSLPRLQVAPGGCQRIAAAPGGSWRLLRLPAAPSGSRRLPAASYGSQRIAAAPGGFLADPGESPWLPAASWRIPANHHVHHGSRRPLLDMAPGGSRRIPTAPGVSRPPPATCKVLVLQMSTRWMAST